MTKTTFMPRTSTLKIFVRSPGLTNEAIRTSFYEVFPLLIEFLKTYKLVLLEAGN